MSSRPIRTGTIRPGPQTNSTTGTCEAGTSFGTEPADAGQRARASAETWPSSGEPERQRILQHLERREPA